MECKRCGHVFRDATKLRDHLGRKTPCVSLNPTENTEEQNARHKCKYCDKTFASAPSMRRHVRQNCKLAKDDDEKESDLRQQIEKLTAMVERLTSAPTTTITNSGTMTIKTNNTQTNISVVQVHPWDDTCCIGVTKEQMAEAYNESAHFREYAGMGCHQMAAAEIGSPYVTGMLMDLVKKAHQDPANRNIYLNDRRADQVLVFKKDGSWEVLPLSEATTLMFDGIIDNIRAITTDQDEARQLPAGAWNALAMAGLLYWQEPECYAKRAKGTMTAHLTNCRNKGENVQAVPALRTVQIPTKKRPEPPLVPTPVMLKPAYGPPITYVPRYPDPLNPALNAERAAAVFVKMRPAKDDISPEYIRKLAATARTEVDMMIKKLWEAVEEEEILKGTDAELADAVIAVYDCDRSLYDS